MAFLMDIWYQAAWSEEVKPSELLARTIAGIPVVLFRTTDGTVAALHDQCPHRFAPLSRGQLEGDQVRCGYHGLAFDKEGQCVHNLHGPVIKAARTRSYRIEERHEAVWIWLGNQDKADPALIRDLSLLDETPETAKFRGNMPTKANYMLIMDNILDLSHANSLHLESLGPLPPGFRMEVTEQDGGVEVTWLAENVEPTLLAQAVLGESIPVNQRLNASWRAPSVIILDGGSMLPGDNQPYIELTRAIHSMTPETETTSHYFYAVTRITDLDNVEMTKAVKDLAIKAFATEDKPMIEAQQERMGTADFWELKPALFSVDNGAVRARRRIDAMLAAEAAAC
jgi:phenylpropionate dioxygenase-like ring-hydroxylating dioxygenase large terminal subunit